MSGGSDRLRFGLVLALVHLEELGCGCAHRHVAGLEPSAHAGRTIRVDLDERRQLRLGPDHLLALANDPAPNPDHGLLLTHSIITNRRRNTYLKGICGSLWRPRFATAPPGWPRSRTRALAPWCRVPDRQPAGHRRDVKLPERYAASAPWQESPQDEISRPGLILKSDAPYLGRAP